MNMTRRLFLGAAAAGLVVQTGCNIGSLMYFLTPDPPNDAKLKHLADKEEAKAPRVVILTYANPDVDVDMIHADREVAEKLATQLKLAALATKEKVDIVPQRKVEDYKNTHTGWKTDIVQIGRRFDAKHVVFLEFRALGMRDPKSVNMFRGRAKLAIHLHDVGSDEPPCSEEVTFNYPDDVRFGQAFDNDSNPEQFRQAFLASIAKKLVPYFIKHPRQDHYSIEKVPNG